MMKTHVAFVCQWYPPEPVEIPAGIVSALTEQGLLLEVLTGIPNYPTGAVSEGYCARSFRTDVLAGVPVHRVPLYPSHDTSARKRFLNYASWATSSAAFGQRLLRRSDVALVYSSPATAALPAMIGKVLWGTPYVLLVQDVWPDSIFASGFLKGPRQRLIYRIVNLFVRQSYALASHVAVISPGMVDLLAGRGVPRAKLSVVYNWLPHEDHAPIEVDAMPLKRRLDIPNDSRVFLYAGNHGRAQALGPLVDAFAHPGTAPSHLVMLGDGVEKQSLQARAAGSDRVHFLDAVPRSEAARIGAAADVHVVSLADAPLFAVTMPSKVQAGLAGGRPMLVISRGDSADVVRENAAGTTALPGSVEDVVMAVARLSSLTDDDLASMGRRGSEVYRETMAREVGAASLAVLLRAAAKTSRRMRRQTSLSQEGTI